MKISELLENVIDFKAARAARKGHSPDELSVDFDLDKLGYKDEADKDHFALVMDEINQEQSKFKLPSFTGLQSIFNFLSQLDIPETDAGISEWFGSLVPEAKGRVQMIAHHKDRVIRAIDSYLNRIKQFKQTLSKISKAHDEVDATMRAYGTLKNTIQRLNSL